MMLKTPFCVAGLSMHNVLTPIVSTRGLTWLFHTPFQTCVTIALDKVTLVRNDTLERDKRNNQNSSLQMKRVSTIIF